VLVKSVDLHLRFSGLVEDRRHALGFGEREERPLHEVALVARRHLAGERLERIERRAFARGRPLSCHGQRPVSKERRIG